MLGSSEKAKRPRLGCLFVLGIGLICIGLLLLNGVLVRSFLMANSKLISELAVQQAIQYVVPVVMIFVEFWIYDLLVARN